MHKTQNGHDPRPGGSWRELGRGDDVTVEWFTSVQSGLRPEGGSFFSAYYCFLFRFTSCCRCSLSILREREREQEMRAGGTSRVMLRSAMIWATSGSLILHPDTSRVLFIAVHREKNTLKLISLSPSYMHIK